MDRHSFEQRSLRRTCSVLVVCAISLAGCGTSVPSTEGGTTTTERSTVTTAPPTTATSPPIAISDLEPLLPTAAELDAGYRLDPATDAADDDDPALDAAMRKACPGAETLLNDNAKDRPSADRSFGTEDNRNVEVKLEPGASLTSKAKDDVKLDELIAAVNDCDVIAYTDEDGVKFQVEFEVQKDTDFGDLGIAMKMRMKVSDASLPQPVEIKAGFRKFLVGDVGVSVSAMSGIDQDTLKAVPGDFDLIDSLSERLEKDVAALVRRD